MNKKLMLMMLAVACTIVSKAQTKKGDQLLGGFIGASISNGTTESYQAGSSSYKTKNHSLSFGTAYSFFVANNLDAGISLGYLSQSKQMILQVLATTICRKQASIFILGAFFCGNISCTKIK